MFDEMVQMKNRKGFTLVEMLVVIAVIAILVSIVVPVIGNSVQKSRAATNAANLRAIEGQLATMRVSQPLVFENAVEQLGVTLDVAFGNMGFEDWQTSILSGTVTGLVERLGFSQFIESGTALSQLAKYHLYHTTAVNEVLTIPATESPIVIENVPTSKACNVGNMVLPEGQEMTVLITDYAIVATYEYGGASYTKEDFAEVAATGEYTGTATGSGGLSGDQAEQNAGQEIACALGTHGDAGKNRHNCSACGDSINTACIPGGAGYTCGYDDCEKGVHPENGQHIDGDDEGYTCDVPQCTTEVHPGTCVSNDGDNECDLAECHNVYVEACGCTKHASVYGSTCNNFLNSKCYGKHHKNDVTTSSGGTLKDCLFKNGGWFDPDEIYTY